MDPEQQIILAAYDAVHVCDNDSAFGDVEMFVQWPELKFCQKLSQCRENPSFR